MKPVVTFALGAALASGVAYYAVHRDTPAPPKEPLQAQPVQQPIVQQPAAPAPTEPAPAAAPVQTHVSKPSSLARTAPARKTEHKEVAQVTHPAPTPEPAAQPAPVTPAPSAQQQNQFPGPPPEEHRAPEPKKPQVVTIPSGTLLTVRLDEALSSERNQDGDTFRATLDSPLVVDGLVIAERGSRVEGRVVETEKGGRVQGLARLAVALTTFTSSDGQKIKIQTESFARNAENSKKSDAAKIGAGAAIGAAIGAIAGGGKGAAIGAGVGGAAGTGGVLATRGKAAEIPVETRMSFRVRDPITITEKIR
jgi:hypothetical protein